MTRFQKITTLLMALLSISLAIILLLLPEMGYVFILLIISIAFLSAGIKGLYNYFTLSRFMVGGKRSLYQGIFLLDLGIFTSTLYDLPKTYILIYLAIIHGFSGLVEVLRVNETRKYGAKTWKLKLSHGIIDIALAIACFAFSSRPATLVFIYCFGLIYSALGKIISVFRKNTFIYIQ